MTGFRRRDSATTPTKVESPVAEKKVPSKGGGKTYHNDALTIAESKEGELYLRVNDKNAVEIKVNGKVVTGFITKDPMTQLQESVEAGRLTEEKAEQIAAKIPEYIKGNVTLVTE